ncbi:MAG: UDP-N-acetylmuramoyl-L-alanine--D-glutamate ligase [Bacteroidetes bacterium]|nr:MAG: UDP-N-acetylmuramoyl-L-alanine--D-glutamate ligase [Bacteroidota bacterium]
MKKVLVLGAGESGVGAAILAKKKGYEVFVSDKGKIKEKYKNVLLHHSIEFEEGLHSESAINGVDLVIKSPGIPDTAEIIQKLRKQNAEIISEIEFAARYTNATLIGITGSNGKTTTTLLLAHILKKAGLKAEAVGNVGQSFAWSVAENEQDYYVIELSSFQLDDSPGLHLHIAILLNITPDHLDRYETFEHYARSKFQITRNQTEQDYFIYNADDEVIASMLPQVPVASRKLPFSIEKNIQEGACLVNNQIVITLKNQKTTMSVFDFSLKGKHNIYNTMASSIAARVLELRKDVIRESLSDFQNVEHRLEHVVDVHGIKFINDSKATNVNSTWYALESVKPPVIWIAGGVDKGNDYSILEPLVKEKVKAIVCLGKDNTKLMEAFKPLNIPMIEAGSMEAAVGISYQIGKKGDTVLLSPACASFDLFDNYEDRGRQFKECVRAL